MLIDLSCPAEVFRSTLPTREIPAVSLLMYNLSDRVIVSAEVTVRLMTGRGAETQRVVFRGRALNGRPHSTFPMNVPCGPESNARSAEVTIDKVWFSDNAVWRRDTGTSAEYTPNQLPVSRGLTNLKYVAGEMAVGYPSQQDGLWVCVCGRPNPDSEEICARCRQPKEMVFTRFSREAVEKQIAQRERQLDLSTRSVREDTARMQRIREAEFRKKQARNRQRIRLAILAALLPVLTAGMLGAGAPALRLWSAARAMEQQNWTGAAAVLRRLGNFPGAPAKLAECEEQIARNMAAAAETPEALEAASQALRALPASDELTALAEETDLRRGWLLLENGDPEGARAAAAALPGDDPRRTDLENQCLFAEADSLLEGGEYEAARELFLTLQNMPEAAEKAAECVYIPAMALMREGKYDEAIAELNRIPNAKDSRSKIQECHYRKALLAENEGDLAAAAAEFLQAGDYPGAAEKTQETVFTLAEAAFAAGDLEEARKLYASLPGYTPAEQHNYECLCLLAQEALDAKDYDRAGELLSAVPEEYENSSPLRLRAAYGSGTAAAKKGDWEKAVSMLEAAGNYKDAADRLDQAIENLARQKLDGGDPEAARELIERIPDSKNYAKMLKEADYLSAVNAAENGGDPETCLELFQAMGSYADAETWVLRMYYAQAAQAEERGETLNAAALYTRAGEWNDAKEKAEALYDAYYGERADAAREAAAEGNYTLAATLLETLLRDDLPEKYKDLNTLYEDSLLNAGIQLFRDGRPYEAAAYFRMVGDTRKTSRWLNSVCYQIPGEWENRNGEVIAVFREDGHCEIAGEAFTFLVPDSFTIQTGPPEGGELTATHRISNLTKNRMTLRDLRKGHEQSWDLFRRETVEDDGEKDGN